MSDSEGKKELVGIARSIDALFSGDPPVSAASVEAGLPTHPAARQQAPPAPVDAPDLMDAGFGEVGAEAVDLEPADGEAFELAPLDAEAVDPEPDDTQAFELEPLDTAAAETDEESRDEDAAASSADPPAASEDAESEPVTPLGTAVEAYLAGDSSKENEISALAELAIERYDFDTVARGVRRLAIGAGDPPDPRLAGLASAIASEPVLGRLAVHLGAERDERARQETLLACRVLGRPMAEAIRDQLADSTDRFARRVHCDALVAMGPAGREVIEEMAHDDNRFLVRNAVAILGETGGDRAVELVTSALANPDARVRREALRSLAKLGDEGSGELVLGLLEDPDHDVRLAAAVAAGELHVERSLRTLIKLLDQTKEADDAILLIRALGHLGDPGAVTSIEKWAVRSMFSKPRTDARIAAYRALHQIGTPHARRLLNQAVDDKEPEVKAAVKEILGMR